MKNNIYTISKILSESEIFEFVMSNFKGNEWSFITNDSLNEDKDVDANLYVNENGDFLTVTCDLEYDITIFAFGVNITELKSDIEITIEECKKHYTHDYGDVYINIYTRDLYINCGDGGAFKSDADPKDIAKADMDNDYEKLDKFMSEPSFTLNFILEAEYDPNVYNSSYYKITPINENEAYVRIGKLRDMFDNDAYNEYVDTIIKDTSSIEYNKKETLEDLERKMQQAVDDENYEKAAKYRDRIIEIKKDGSNK